MRKIPAYSLLSIILCLVLLSSCQSYRLEKKLNPDEQEFLSKVRFIITSEERRTFLRLPPSEREAFIKEFWAKRDPDPETEINEYREEYFSRIDQANRLFRGEGTPGWLTDRGRIYILFGPPYSRKMYPAEMYGTVISAREIWYYGYGNFPVIFIDRHNNGVYRLYSTDTAYLNEINYALRSVREEREEQIRHSTELLLDFSIELSETSNIPLILIKVPYNTIWFTAEEDTLKTTLNLDLTIIDINNKKKILQHNEDYSISINENSLRNKVEEDYAIEIPLILAEGVYSVQATLTNNTGGKSVYKEFQISV